MFKFKRLFFSVSVLASFSQATLANPNVSNPFDPYDPFPDSIVKGGLHVNLNTVATGLAAPNSLADPGDGSGRLFVTDQTGYVRVIQNGVMQASPFLDVHSSLVSLNQSYDERGLLNIAFSPQFSTPGTAGYGKFYTYTSQPVTVTADFTVPINPGTSFNHQNVINEWQVDPNNPNAVNLASKREILRVDWPQMNHNSGQLAFGPDGLLYVGLGDGGNGNDIGNGHGTSGNGQNPGNVLGSILRIDPNGHNSANGQYGIPADNPFIGNSDFVPEIYAYGLRHPWRFSFDTLTGKLVEGETGQGTIEEVNIITAGGNFGWNLKEGQFKFDPVTTLVSDDLTGLPPGLTDPVLQYDHSEGTALIGGFVYHGSALPQLDGKYIFGDWGAFAGPTGRLFAGDLSTGNIEEINIDNMDLSAWILGFGQDAAGELYLLANNSLGPKGTTGVVYKLTSPVPLPSAFWLFGSALVWIGKANLRRQA